VARRISAYQPSPARHPEAVRGYALSQDGGGGGDVGGDGAAQSSPQTATVRFAGGREGVVEASMDELGAQTLMPRVRGSMDLGQYNAVEAGSPSYRPITSAVAVSPFAEPGPVVLSGRQRRRMRRRARAVASGLAMMHVQRTALAAGLRAAKARLVDVRVHVAQVGHVRRLIAALMSIALSRDRDNYGLDSSSILLK
jgi:hypothetical protein